MAPTDKEQRALRVWLEWRDILDDLEAGLHQWGLEQGMATGSLTIADLSLNEARDWVEVTVVDGYGVVGKIPVSTLQEAKERAEHAGPHDHSKAVAM